MKNGRQRHRPSLRQKTLWALTTPNCTRLERYCASAIFASRFLAYWSGVIAPCTSCWFCAFNSLFSTSGLE